MRLKRFILCETQAFVNARSKNPDRVLVGRLDLPEGRIWNRVGGLSGKRDCLQGEAATEASAWLAWSPPSRQCGAGVGSGARNPDLCIPEKHEGVVGCPRHLEAGLGQWFLVYFLGAREIGAQ